jgi:ribosome-associated protein
MDIKKLQALVIDALEDIKAQDIHLYDTTHLTSMFDRIVIASGTSNRQTKALAASVRDKVKAAGGHIISIEGEGTGEWVLVDLGDMVVHIMQPAIRAYYRLEELWGDKEVKFGAAKRSTGLARASEEKAPVAETKKAPAKKAATRTAPAKSAPAKSSSKRSAPAKSALAKSSSTRSAPAKSATAKTAAKSTRKPVSKTASTTVAKKAPAKKPVSRTPVKTPIKKIVSKKTTKAPAKRAQPPAKKAAKKSASR